MVVEMFGVSGVGGWCLIRGVGGHVIEEEWLQPGQQAASEQSHESGAARGQHPQDSLRVGHRPTGTDLAAGSRVWRS